MRCVAIVQARMTSTRLPGKVLRPLGSETILNRVVTRVARTRGVDAVCIAAPEGPKHDSIADALRDRPEILVFRGEEDDVLARYANAAAVAKADYFLRVTSDCPWIDPGVCSTVLHAAVDLGGYARTAFDRGFPLGLDCEAGPVALLDIAAEEAQRADEREHVTPFIWRQPDRFPQTIIDRVPDRRAWRLTVDEPADYEAALALDQALGPAAALAGFVDIERLLLDRPQLLTINSGVGHKHVDGAPRPPSPASASAKDRKKS